MIRRIRIENYKCYKKSTLSLKDIVVIVGNNNAGKSTLIEALRLVSYAAKNFKYCNYTELPSVFGLPKAQRGFKINAANLMIDLKCAIYQFESAFAKIDVEFDTKDHIIIYLNSEFVYACVQDSSKNYITTKGKAKLLNISPVKIMPQLGLIKDEEKKLVPDTVEKNIDTRLSSRHFRNELLLYKKEYFNKFVEMAQQTWNGLRIQDLEPVYGDDPIMLYVYDGSFCAEIGNMGSGLQMWLQIIWFLSRCDESDTIILDEPDVYMHPDMQRKVFDIVATKFKQVIVATHSVEIISDVDPQNIVTIDRDTRKFSYANDINGAQSIIDNIGGVHNLSLIRLGSAKKCIFVEGKDVSLLSKIHKQLFPNSNINLNSIPIVTLGGKGRFEEALGAARLFFEETNSEIQTICLLDHDYSTDEEIAKFNSRAEESHLNLHIWKKKEIENYIVTPQIVFSASKLPESKQDELYRELELSVEKYKDSITDQYGKKFFELNKNGRDVTTIMPMAREYVNSKWNTLEEKMALINGKQLITEVIDVLREKFGVVCRKNDFISAMNVHNTSSELLDVLKMFN